MHTLRILSLYVAVVATTLGFAMAQDVCSLPPTKMYVRDATQTKSPSGFASCADSSTNTNPRCDKCDCRQLQSMVKNNQTETWGLCVEDVDSCVSSEAPGRVQCGGSDMSKVTPPRNESATILDSNAKGAAGFETGNVHVSNGANVPGANGNLEQGVLDAGTGVTGAEEGKSKTSMMFVVACAVAAVAGIAVFAFVRSKKEKEKKLKTPKTDYKDTDTAKAQANGVARNTRGNSRYRGSNAGMDPYATGPYNQSRANHGSDNHDSTSSSEEDDHNNQAGFGAFATSSDFGDLDLQTDMSIGYGMGHSAEDDEYYNDDDDTRVSIHSTDDEEEVDLRESTNGNLFSSASALAYESEGSPRKSIEF